MKPICIAALLLTTLAASPAFAQELKFFYCYVVDAATGTVLFSDRHELGPVSERASYGAQFASFLSTTGKVSAGAQGYCVMRPRTDQIEQAQRGLASEPCMECGDADTFEQVAWTREGRSTGVMLDGPLVASSPPATTDPPRAPTPNRAELEETPAHSPGMGVYVMGRSDELDVVFTANEANGAFLGPIRKGSRRS